jgi:endonuclease/exonuclease/phosphatase family metal-dependent hydrolase
MLSVECGMANTLGRRPSALLVAVGLLAGALVAVPAARQAALRLKVATYNIHHGAGTGECAEQAPSRPRPSCGYDLARTTRVLASFGADVLALQEVDRFWTRSANDDQPAKLGDALGMSTCYGPNLVHGPDAHAPVAHEYGTLVLSRHPIEACRNTLLPQPVGEQRGLLDATIQVGERRIRILNTHLDTQRESRGAQVAALVAAVGSGSQPMVLLGDFNAEPDAEEMAPLFAVLTDAWRSAGQRAGHTYPAAVDAAPDRRIDYIFTSREGVRVVSAEVLVANETRATSDHYPVLATLEFHPVR